MTNIDKIALALFINSSCVLVIALFIRWLDAQRKFWIAIRNEQAFLDRIVWQLKVNEELMELDMNNVGELREINLRQVSKRESNSSLKPDEN